MSDNNEQITSSTTQKVSQNKITKLDILRIILRIGLYVLCEFVLPFVLYYVLRKYIREVWALLASSAPPFIIVIYGIISKRRIDITGVLIIISFIVSAVVSLLKDDPRIQLLRKCVVTSAIGILMITTLIPMKFGTFRMRPFAFYFFKDLASGIFAFSSSKFNLTGLTEDEPTEERWDRHWVSYQYFRRGFIIITAIWGFGLIYQIPIRVIIIYKLSIDQAFLFVNILEYFSAIIMGLLTPICAWWMKKQSNKITDKDATASI